MGQAASSHSSLHSARSSSHSSSSRLPSRHSARGPHRQPDTTNAQGPCGRSDHNARTSSRRSCPGQSAADLPPSSSNPATGPASTLERDPLMEALDSHNPPGSSHSTSDISMHSQHPAGNRSRSRTVTDGVNNQPGNIEDRFIGESASTRFGLLPRAWTNRSEARSSRNTSSRITRRRLARSPYSPARGDMPRYESSPTDRFPGDGDSSSPRPRLNRRSRLSHVRHSIAHPISHFFSQGHSRPYQNGRPTSSPHTTTASSSRMSLDPISDANVDDNPNQQDDASQENPASGVPTNPPGREEVSHLSRILQMAATAIAAQLSGRPGTEAQLQPIGDESMDRSLQTLVQSLQRATANLSGAEHAAEEGSGDGIQGRQQQERQQEEGEEQQNQQQQQQQQQQPQPQPQPQPQQEEEQPDDEPSPQLNYLRAFIFSGRDAGHDALFRDGQADPNRPASATGNVPGTTSTNGRGAATRGDQGRRRLVTLVIVGVRPIIPPSGSIAANSEAEYASGNNDNNPRSPLDSIVDVPISSANPLRRRRSESPEENRRGSRIMRRWSNEMAETAPRGDAEQESGRRQTRQSSNSLHQTSPSLSSSPGPMPPPTTPAGPNQSSANSPTRPSSSLDELLAIPTIEEHGDRAQEQGTGGLENETAESFLDTVRHRRRSASEAARHRGLGSGSARRNGVVEPDGTLPAAGRSWMIYVVGTNLSENHPALATPSLFTDNPSYEDLALLSTLLGPVKPPVASQDDVNASGGVYRTVARGDSLLAEPLNAGDNSVSLAANERCLICLSDYQPNEENRRLMQCKHMYHKTCIDEWLTTGRNSCPLCREQGVSGTEGNSVPSNPPGMPAFPPPMPH